MKNARLRRCPHPSSLRHLQQVRRAQDPVPEGLQRTAGENLSLDGTDAAGYPTPGPAQETGNGVYPPCFGGKDRELVTGLNQLGAETLRSGHSPGPM